MRDLVRPAIIACLACTFILFFPQPLAAANNEAAQLKQEKKQLIEMKAKEEKTAAELSEALRKEKLGKKRMDELQDLLKKQTKIISSIDRRLSALNERQDEIEKQVRNLAEAHGKATGRLRLTSQLAFESQRSCLARPFAAPTRERTRFMMINCLSAGALEMKNISMARDREQKELSRIERQVALSEKKMATEQKAEEKLQSRQKEEQELLARVKKEKEAKSQELATLRAKIKRMETLVARVEQQAREKEQQRLKKANEGAASARKTAPSSQAPRLFAALPGGVSAPLSGRVITRFGKQYDKMFDVEIENSGVELEAASGADVKAVSTGETAFVGEVSGFGKVVIIQHGSGLFSVYGKLENYLVKTGRKVSKGDVVGRLPKSPSGKSVLYFELRSGGAAVDPASVISLY